MIGLLFLRLSLHRLSSLLKDVMETRFNHLCWDLAVLAHFSARICLASYVSLSGGRGMFRDRLVNLIRLMKARERKAAGQIQDKERGGYHGEE